MNDAVGAATHGAQEQLCTEGKRTLDDRRSYEKQLSHNAITDCSDTSFLVAARGFEPPTT